MPTFYTPHDDFRRRRGAYLPHWTQGGATYFLTFRLNDALPASVLESYKHIRDEALMIARANGDDAAVATIESVFRRKVERFLDRGHGQAWMFQPKIAEIVAGAITFFQGQRYDLWAWCVMPNHVHAVVQPFPGHSLSQIQKSWKGYSGAEIAKRLGRKGAIWQPEGWDHVVRSYEYLKNFVRYTVINPERAGLKDWRWVWALDLT